MKRLCVSACLLGVPCRWKGDAKPCAAVQRLAERAVVRALDPATRSAMEQSHAESAKIAELIPFCPELAAGLGCPRPPIELVREAPGAPIRVLHVDRTGDATDALRAACEAQAEALERAGGVDGFVLKARSPSCGLSSPLHDAAGRETGAAPGLWAAFVRERFPGAEFREEP